MKSKRSYRQYCALARALDVVGERWTLLIVRNLLLGPRRYSDLLGELPGITTNLLAKRLKELEHAGILERQERPPPVAATVYALSPVGAALEPAIMELGRWGGRLMGAPRASDTVNIGWGLLSLKRRYRGGLDLVAELCIGARRFELELSDRRLGVLERPSERAALVVNGSLETFRGLLFGGAQARQLVESGALETNDRRLFRQFVSAFEGVRP